jgi:hypothetical protein
VVSTPLKNMKLSWDDEIPNIWKKQKKHVPNHQPVHILALSHDTWTISTLIGQQVRKSSIHPENYVP